ncbi:MAG: T9SS type A sorting domain-containing protein [Ignavibacterium sp.]|nr:T9SS type A sorting domain-containing protein [Ignavibacterium sp.]
MPVELNSFQVTQSKNDILLNWSTSTEQNNYGFEIERSTILTSLNYGIWEKIGFVQGSGNSNSPKKYSFTDNTLTKSGKYAYRLKQIDNDGSFEYSKIVEVDFVMLDKFTLEQNYPNPFNPTTVISYQIPVNSNVSLKLYDVLGNEVATLVNEYKEAGRYKVELNVGQMSLSSGIYFYKLQAGEFTEIKKMILSK